MSFHNKTTIFGNDGFPIMISPITTSIFTIHIMLNVSVHFKISLE